ncbi:hypothetical protein [Metaclostridioides mangenotii]|uniref:hypothetical protein n=1 Tax=Metaclostridioides mangenotii TaxID=1540 RepID=UPI0028E37C10|nr:hypothetical protein [Clostridioides mangenotii]
MNNDERIKLLESKVEELQAKLGGLSSWTKTSRKVDEELNQIFQGEMHRGYGVKYAASTILNRTFNKKNVKELNEHECKEALKLFNFILDFVRENKIDN